MSNIFNETLSLAALFQSCAQIQRIARTGQGDESAMAPVIRGLIITNPKSCEDIYKPSTLAQGYRQIPASFGFGSKEKSPDVLEITTIAFKLITLEQAIEKNQHYFNMLGQNIDKVRQSILSRHSDYENASDSEILSEDCLNEFSSLYQSIISPNFPKLVIYGAPEHLKEDSNQSKIRALLLSAIRAIVLWRQLGGRRRYLIFRRNAIIQCARDTVSSLHKFN
ncbi:DUF489 family protein [Anaerobiospirillum thomasii]|uniref:High frequency lysogenization protein HflD n=1 Tax=Anaerobiospirillum thomasii TaxID=179995 RepID=A0A2X0V724_9GAMM|nr:DUF489 family protein [Anaerobiospirillum thomasii]SPT70149.1 High frequency lysogenization protein HflD [Anaerobiospirillum thomasii]